MLSGHAQCSLHLYFSGFWRPLPLLHYSCLLHCVKSVQIRSYFWSVFSCIQSEYRKIRTRNNSVFGHFSRIASSNETLEILFLEIICASWNMHFKRHALYENHRVRDHSFSTFPRISEKLILLPPRGKKFKFSRNVLRTY